MMGDRTMRAGQIAVGTRRRLPRRAGSGLRCLSRAVRVAVRSTDHSGARRDGTAHGFSHGRHSLTVYVVLWESQSRAAARVPRRPGARQELDFAVNSAPAEPPCGWLTG